MYLQEYLKPASAMICSRYHRSSIEIYLTLLIASATLVVGQNLFAFSIVAIAFRRSFHRSFLLPILSDSSTHTMDILCTHVRPGRCSCLRRACQTLLHDDNVQVSLNPTRRSDADVRPQCSMPIRKMPFLCSLQVMLLLRNPSSLKMASAIDPSSSRAMEGSGSDGVSSSDARLEWSVMVLARDWLLSDSMLGKE